jgi:hypothetical protein
MVNIYLAQDQSALTDLARTLFAILIVRHCCLERIRESSVVYSSAVFLGLQLVSYPTSITYTCVD